MKIINGFIVAIFIVIMFSSIADAQELVWRPINPSFGGNPFNAEWLLNQAQIQNKLEEETESTLYNRDALEDFKESMNMQILSQISRQLVSSIFGEEGVTDGHYELGDYSIDILSTIEGINITIYDISTGGQTNIIVPYF